MPTESELLRIKRELKARAKKLHLGKARTGAYVYGTLRKIRGNPTIIHPRIQETFEEYGVTSPKTQKRMMSVILRKLPASERTLDGMEYAIDQYFRKMGEEAYDETMKSMGYTRVRGNPSVHDSVMKIINQDGEEKTDGEVLDELHDYLKSLPTKDSYVRDLINTSGQNREMKEEGEILDEVYRTIAMHRGVQENPKSQPQKPRKPSKNDLLGLVDYMREAAGDAPDAQIERWWIRCANWIESQAT